MEVIIQPDSRSASLIGARIIARQVRENPRSVLGLATGSSPLQLYDFLAQLHREEHLDFSLVTTFNLDEFVGLPRDHPASYHTFMKTHLFDRINVSSGRIHIPDGLATDVPAACRRYEEEIKTAGGIDIQVLGVGTDGHIGFNEPTSSLASRTRIKTLLEETRRENAAAFGGEDKVPLHVITMGVGTIMESRLCLLLAFGKKKARAVAAAVEGPITAMAPVSILQMHPRAVVLVDKDAASELAKAEYYRKVYEHKPEWQSY